MSIVKFIFFMIGDIIFLFGTYMVKRMDIKEIKAIKPDNNDRIVKAKVVNHIRALRSSDIHPVVMTETGKKYIFYSYKRPRAYPIGKTCMLKESIKTGKVYDKKDIKRGLLYAYALIGFWAFGLFLGVAYIIKNIVL